MKNIRKISALLVALAVMASFCVPALAVPTTQEVNDIAFYDSFENRSEGEHVAIHDANGYGWHSGGNAKNYGQYIKLNGEMVTSLDCPSSFELPINWAYTLKYQDAYTGKIALEAKLMPTMDEEFEIRLVNRNLTAEGGTTYNAGDAITKNHMVYGILNFTDGKFRYTNVNKQLKEEGGYGDVVERGPTIPVALNEWVTLRYEIDTDSETYSIYANGTQLFEDAPMFIKDIAKADRTFAQSVTNIGFMTIAKPASRDLGLKIDDVAVYDLESTTKYYWSDEVTVPEYSYDVGATLYDAKLEIPLVDANGAATTKTVKTPVRLAKLDSSKVGVQLATVDGLQDDAVVNFNKEVVLSQGDTWEDTDFTDWVNGKNNAKTATETTTEGENKFLRVTANGYTSYAAIFNDATRFAGAKDVEISFKIRFGGDVSAMASASTGFPIQFIDSNSYEMPTLYFIPGTNQFRYAKTDSAAAAGTNGAKLITGTPDISVATGTGSQWNTVKLVYENDTVKVYVNGTQGTFNNHRSAYASSTETTHTAAPVPANYGIQKILFKVYSASEMSAIIDLDDFKIVKKEIKGNATLTSIGEQEWTTAKGAVTFPTQVEGTLSDGSTAYYDIVSLTPTGAAATDVGEYTYTAAVAGYDSPVSVKVNVVENAYDLSVESAAVDTAYVTVTSNVSHDSPATLFVATFRNNKLLNVQKKAISATENYTSEIERASGDVVKAFVWNVNGVTPLALSAEATVAE